jgi:hypothetical protein
MKLTIQFIAMRASAGRGVEDFQQYPSFYLTLPEHLLQEGSEKMVRCSSDVLLPHNLGQITRLRRNSNRRNLPS